VQVAVERLAKVGNNTFADPSEQIGLPETEDGLRDEEGEQQQCDPGEHLEAAAHQRTIHHVAHNQWQRQAREAVGHEDHACKSKQLPVWSHELQQPCVACSQPAQKGPVGERHAAEHPGRASR